MFIGMRTFPLIPPDSVRYLRLRYGLRLAEVAVASGVSAARLGALERDPAIARLTEMAAIDRAITALARGPGFRDDVPDQGNEARAWGDLPPNGTGPDEVPR